MGDEAFKRKLACSVVIAIKKIVSLLKSFIANALKKFKCVCVTMCSLVMRTFSRDLIKTEIDQLKY